MAIVYHVTTPLQQDAKYPSSEAVTYFNGKILGRKTYAKLPTSDLYNKIAYFTTHVLQWNLNRLNKPYPPTPNYKS